MCPYAVVVGGMSEEYIQCVHVWSITFPSGLHELGNLYLTRKFITYKNSTNKSKKVLYKNHASRVGVKTS